MAGKNNLGGLGGTRSSFGGGNQNFLGNNFNQGFQQSAFGMSRAGGGFGKTKSKRMGGGFGPISEEAMGARKKAADRGKPIRDAGKKLSQFRDLCLEMQKSSMSIRFLQRSLSTFQHDKRRDMMYSHFKNGILRSLEMTAPNRGNDFPIIMDLVDKSAGDFVSANGNTIDVDKWFTRLYTEMDLIFV